MSAQVQRDANNKVEGCQHSDLDEGSKEPLTKISNLPQLSKSEMRSAWFCCFWLNMSALWSYQSLLSAQDVYQVLFPTANISFWGTVLNGSSMFIGQALSMIFQIDERGGSGIRLQVAYVVFAVFGLIVLFFIQVPVILGAFFLTGFCNPLTEARLYQLAAKGSDKGELTGAVNLGNGSSGAINVIAAVVIRLSVIAVVCGFGDAAKVEEASEQAEHLSMKIFLAVLFVICLSCLPVYWRLVSLPTLKQRLEMFQRESAGSAIVSTGEHMRHMLEVARKIWGSMFTQFACFFISLLVWPGMSCTAPVAGSSFDFYGGAWFCSPVIIAAFDIGDWFGRFSATLPAFDRCLKGQVRLNSLGAARLLFVGAILACTVNRPEEEANPVLPWIVVVLIVFCGFSNGLVATLCIMRGPLLVPEKDREMAAQLLVLSLYLGIAGGSIVAAVLANLHVI